MSPFWIVFQVENRKISPNSGYRVKNGVKRRFLADFTSKFAYFLGFFAMKMAYWSLDQARPSIWLGKFFFKSNFKSDFFLFLVTPSALDFGTFHYLTMMVTYFSGLSTDRLTESDFWISVPCMGKKFSATLPIKFF